MKRLRIDQRKVRRVHRRAVVIIFEWDCLNENVKNFPYIFS